MLALHFGKRNSMTVIAILFYTFMQLQPLEGALLTGHQQVVFPKLLEKRNADGGKVLRINEELTLNLEKSSILGKNFLLRTYEDDIMKHTYHDGQILEEELYHDPKYLASVMVSEDNGLQVEGVLGPRLRIKPLIEGRISKGISAHVLYEMAEDAKHDSANIGVNWSAPMDISGRDDRSDSMNVAASPEVLVAVDSTFRSQFKSVLSLLKYMIILFNSANVRYMTVQEPRVRLKLYALEVLEERMETTFLYRVENYVAAYRSLDMFRDYVARYPQRYGDFDVVYLVTGLDMAAFTGHKWDVQLQGIAYVAGACTNRKVGIGEDRVGTFFGVRIMSHEIGHLLGCPHDGETFGSYTSVHCPWSYGYIMSYKVQDSNSMKFSSCCNENIRKFVRSTTGHCVLEQATTTRINKDNYTKGLPGEYITKEKLCNSTYPEVPNTYLMENEGGGDCRGRCYMPASVYRLGYKTAIFPDNYPCRGKMVCINGDCVKRRPKYINYRPYE